MRRVLINMQNTLFCDAIAQTLRKAEGLFDVFIAETPAQICDKCSWLEPYALLLEVTGYQPWSLEERMKIRNCVRQKHPACKIVFIVDENVEKELSKQVKQAKKDGLIDQFIYGSISASYLSDIVDSL